MMTTTFDWTSVATSWDRHRAHVEDFKAPLSDALLAWLELRPGGRVLELGAGTGVLALRLAASVGPLGRVLASDVAPGMVALLRRTLAGVPGVEVRELDARATDLPDDSFDAVVFRMGLMFLDEPERALRECRRVLAPGGRVALAVWAGPEHNPWLACLGMAAMMHGLVSGGPPTGPGGVFSLADPARLEALARSSGLTEVRVQAVQLPARFATPDEHFDVVAALAGPLSGILAAADAEQIAAVRGTAAQAVERFRTPDGLVVPGRALLCTARCAA